jgi:hypothetical protein
MKEEKESPIALIDLDGTLIDYKSDLKRDLLKLKGPDEPESWEDDKEPKYIKARMDLIRASSDWWENLTPLQRGLDVVLVMRQLGFRIVVCTQGPKKNAEAWKGKMLWVQKNLIYPTDIIITRDKGLIYGNVLMDDYPGYITNWLKHRPRGLVIMPAHDYNKDFAHKNVIRDDGSVNATVAIQKALQEILKRREII